MCGECSVHTIIKTVLELGMSTATWSVVHESALAGFRAFGLVIVVCNLGKHRSLPVGCKLSHSIGAELVDRINREGRLRYADVFIVSVRQRLLDHIRNLGDSVQPVLCVRVTNQEWNAPAWMRSPGEGIIIDIHIYIYIDR